MLRRDVAPRSDLHGRDQLVSEILGPPSTGTNQIGKGMRGVEVAPELTVVAFNAPDGDHNMLVHAVTLLDRRQGPGVFFQPVLAVRDPLGIDQERHVVPDRSFIFRLRRGEANDLFVILRARQHPFGNLRTDTRLDRLVFQGGDTGAEGRRLGSKVACPHERQQESYRAPKLLHTVKPHRQLRICA